MGRVRRGAIGVGRQRRACPREVVFLAVAIATLALTHRLAATPQERAAPETLASVAVLVFSNISGDATDDWIGVGIAETVATSLDSVDGLIVVRIGSLETGTPAASAVGAPPIEVTPGLDASWVVSGAYQRLGRQIRLTARVVEVTTGKVLQSVTIDGVVEDLFALQDRLAAELRTAVESGQGQLFAVAPGAAEGPHPPGPQSVPVQQRAAGSAPGNAGMIDGPPPPEAPATITRDAEGRATVRAVRLTEPLRIDGDLDESVYETTESFSGFLQQLPDEGAPATERTDVWVFFDDTNVYVSARLWDSAPESQWVADDMQRDSMQLINNERFSVGFDTFYDRRNAMVFMLNPIGGFRDEEITDEDRPNGDWNPVWTGRPGRFDGGWTVEMAVPFKSLRYQPGTSQLWGLQLGRRIRWKNETAYLTPIPASAGPGMFRVSAAATLTGLEVPTGDRRFEIKPYAIGSLATDVNAVPNVSNKGAGDFGMDVKYGVTQNLTADFTYNTDFAQVEVDEQQVNLTRFSLFFPEKREFFLEARGTFDFGQGVRFGGSSSSSSAGRRGGGFLGGGDAPTVFFSRRIGLEGGQTVPILGGGRLTGKVGDFSVGALNIYTDDTLSAGALATNFTVIRIKRDVLRRSRIGGIFTGRSVSTRGPGSNAVYGLDAAFSFYDNVNFNGYYAQSRTPGLSGDDASYQAAFTYNSDRYALQVDHLLVGDNFNPEVGFLRRDDFRRTFITAQYSPRPSAIDAVRQFTWGGSVDYITNGDGFIETRIAQARFGTEFENSDRFNVDIQENYELLDVPFSVASDVTIPVGGYGFRDYFLSYSLGQQRQLSGTVTLQRGEFFNGRITAIGYRRGRVSVTPQFSFEPGVSINRIELPGGRFTAKLVTSRMTYTLTPRMFFSGLLQYNSSTDSLNTNVRLRWEYQPGSELFVVYNDVRDTEFRGSLMLENRAFVVKFTRLFRF